MVENKDPRGNVVDGALKEKPDLNIPSLDTVVLDALTFFTANRPPHLDIDGFKSPFVVGSGNAYNTGTILFAGKDAVFADESNFKEIIEASDKKTRDGLPRDVVVVSASGGKDAGWETKLAQEYGLRTTLLTTKPQSEAAMIADEVIPFKSINEPYTYNTSTYMGMMLGATGEDPKQIEEEVKKLQFPEGFGEYKGYAFVLPDRFMQICPMLEIKKDELFGPYVSLRAFSQGHARHAKFVIKTPEELVISLGDKNEFFGHPDHRWDIDLPNGADFATVMALTYYIVGNIQNLKPQYFKEHISEWLENAHLAYKKEKPLGTVIVPGSA